MPTRPLALSLVLLFVACSSADDGPGDPDDPELPSIRATVLTSGSERDGSVTVHVCEDSPNAACQVQAVSPNGEVTFPSLAPGDYYVYLRDVAENCSLIGEWILPVPLQDSTVTVDFAIHCRGRGTVRVSAVTSGANQPAVYVVNRQAPCDDYYIPCDRRALAPSGSVDFQPFPGSQTFLLEDVPVNCAVLAPGNPATVTVIEDAIVELRYEVACE